MKKENYTFVTLKDRLYCYSYINSIWKTEFIDGEPYLEIEEENCLDWNMLLKKLNERHNSEHELKNVCITLIKSSENTVGFSDDFSKMAKQYKCTNWQIFFLEEWLEKEEIHSLNVHCIIHDVLPKIKIIEYLNNNDKKNKQKLMELKRHIDLIEGKETDEIHALIEENKSLSEKYKKIQSSENEKETLLKKALEKNKRLLEESKVVKSPDTNDLVVYLPLFFSDIWTKIKTSDIACFAESLQIPEIPSPYYEPSNDCLHRLKRRFQQLPLARRSTILDCCKDINNQYEIRRLSQPLLDNNN